MHELSYAEAVLESVLHRAAGRQVAAVGVQIGAVHRVVAEAFDQSFLIAALGTEAEGARTELVVRPGVAHCRDCRGEVETLDALIACPLCGSFAVDVHGGDEVVLTWIAYAEAADAPAQVVAAHTHERS